MSVAGLSCIASAQSAIEYERLAGLASPAPGSPSPLARMLQDAEARIVANGFDEPDELLQSAAKLTHSIFEMPSLHRQKAAIDRISGGDAWGDNLLVEYTFQEGFGEGLILLVDTPYESHYLLRVRGGRMSTQSDLTAFLRTALVWEKEPLTLRDPALAPQGAALGGALHGPALRIILPSDRVDIIHFIGDVAMPRSPYSHVADILIEGALQSDGWYLSLVVGKSLTGRYFAAPPRIPERFPPLSDRVKSWSSPQIRAEVGRHVRPFNDSPDFTGDRDRILIAELARRGLTDDDIINLLGSPEVAPEDRLLALILALDDAGATPLVKRVFTQALEIYRRLGPQGNDSVTRLFKAAANRHCEANVESQALDVLREGVFQRGPLSYLASCSTSGETVAALGSMRLPTPDLEEQREFTLQSIRRRIKAGK